MLGVSTMVFTNVTCSSHVLSFYSLLIYYVFHIHLIFYSYFMLHVISPQFYTYVSPYFDNFLCLSSNYHKANYLSYVLYNYLCLLHVRLTFLFLLFTLYPLLIYTFFFIYISYTLWSCSHYHVSLLIFIWFYTCSLVFAHYLFIWIDMSWLAKLYTLGPHWYNTLYL